MFARDGSLSDWRPGSGRPADAQRRGQVPDTGRAGAGRGLHGVPRSRHRRGLREPPHRGGHGVLPGGMAGGSGPLVRPHPSGRSAPLERRGRGDVPDREAAPLGLSGARPRWPPRLVPVRGEDGAAGRRASLVHPWRGLRHHRAQADGGGARRRAESAVGGARHRRRAGGGAEPLGLHRPLQPDLRAHQRVLVRRSARPLLLGPVPGSGGGTGLPGTARGAPSRAAAVVRERLDRAWRRPAPDRLVQYRAAGCGPRTDARHHDRHRHHRAQARWNRRCSRSAAGSSARSARTCTTGWAST